MMAGYLHFGKLTNLFRKIIYTEKTIYTEKILITMCKILTNERKTEIRHNNSPLREINTGIELRFSCHLEVKH